MTVLADALDLARWQFGLTTLYHFIFVPLTLGLAPFLAVMQTLWYRTGDEKWLRLTRFFGTLFLINFAIGVATGLVMEFQFGMNWSAFSAYVGDIFGSPLAIEGLGAFMLEATFIGLWIFGRDRLSPRLHLMTVYLVWLGTWLSAYFILAANSWMQHPVGYEINSDTGRAEANDIFDILFQKFVWFAWGHVLLAGLLTGGFLVLGVSCWHLLRGRNVELFRKAAKLAIIVMLPLSGVQLIFGSEFGVAVTDVQPMKIAATEALWETEQPASFSLFQIGGYTVDDQTPSFSVDIPGLLSFLATNSFHGQVIGINELQAQYEQQYGPGNYIPDVRLLYWSMRVMAYLATLLFFLAAWGAWVLWRKQLERREVVPARRDRGDRVPVPRELRRLAAHGGRAPTLGGLGAAQDRGRRVVHRQHVDSRAQPRRVRVPVHDPRLRRPLADAPIRAGRPTGDRSGRRGGSTGACAGLLTWPLLEIQRPLPAANLRLPASSVAPVSLRIRTLPASLACLVLARQ